MGPTSCCRRLSYDSTEHHSVYSKLFLTILWYSSGDLAYPDLLGTIQCHTIVPLLLYYDHGICISPVRKTSLRKLDVLDDYGIRVRRGRHTQTHTHTAMITTFSIIPDDTQATTIGWVPRPTWYRGLSRTVTIKNTYCRKLPPAVEAVSLPQSCAVFLNSPTRRPTSNKQSREEQKNRRYPRWRSESVDPDRVPRGVRAKLTNDQKIVQTYWCVVLRRQQLTTVVAVVLVWY